MAGMSPDLRMRHEEVPTDATTYLDTGPTMKPQHIVQPIYQSSQHCDSEVHNAENNVTNAIERIASLRDVQSNNSEANSNGIERSKYAPGSEEVIGDGADFNRTMPDQDDDTSIQVSVKAICDLKGDGKKDGGIGAKKRDDDKRETSNLIKEAAARKLETTRKIVKRNIRDTNKNRAESNYEYDPSTSDDDSDYKAEEIWCHCKLPDDGNVMTKSGYVRNIVFREETLEKM
ncbi:hypothetical protein N0V90_005907 [Kalmusia sp. IMI 367209]|nr:hypothetical protein N0V90_005907 [Kalmusia sp. IMI 367209]